jgi:hypothetical protein
MKKFIAAILILCFSTSATASCQWNTIKQLPDGGFEYSAALNLCVGQLVLDNQTQAQEIADLNKAIDLKSLAINMSDQRVALWEKTADNEQQRLSTIESDQKHDDVLYFGLGVLTTFLAAYGAAQIIHR